MIRRSGKSTASGQQKRKCVAKFRKWLCFGVKVYIKIPTLADTIVSNKGRYYGAGDRTRTGTLSPAVDFESTTSTNSITPAGVFFVVYRFQPPLLIFLYGGRRFGGNMSPPFAVPGVLLGGNACVAHRPLHLLHPRFFRHRRRSGSQRWILSPLRLPIPSHRHLLDTIHHFPENSKGYFYIILLRKSGINS